MNTFDFEKPLRSERFSETGEGLVAGRRVRLVKRPGFSSASFTALC